MEYSTLNIFYIKLHVFIHNFGAYGLVANSLGLVIDKSIVQTKLNVVYCALIQGTLFTVSFHQAKIGYQLMQRVNLRLTGVPSSGNQ